MEYWEAYPLESEDSEKYLPQSATGYSLSELEPRLFSFNNPVGACPDCDGLGVRQFFDSDRVVAHPELSLAGGAVRGWDRRNVYYFQLIRSLSRHYGFDIETPSNFSFFFNSPGSVHTK